MLFLKTIVISCLLGVIGGSSAGLAYRYVNSVQANVPYINTTQPILLSSNSSCCIPSEEDVPTVGEEIVFAQTPVSEEKPAEIKDEPITPEVTPSPEPVEEEITAILVKKEIEPEATDSAIPTPTPSSTPVIQPSDSSDHPLNAEIIFNKVNQLRIEASLPEFEKEPRACELAESRAPQLYNEIVVTGRMHVGLFNRGLPYWVTENIIYIRNEQQAINWWLHSPIHHRQMYGNYKYSCVACLGNSCVQIFTDFIPKVNQSVVK
jgi:uncharacterized protein YkwD